jgi:succinyl-CoA synthetase alpha subunit
MSVTFIPGPGVKMATLEAIDAGVKTIVGPVERVPLHDIMVMMAVAKEAGVTIVGPGSIGVITPGQAVAGWLGGNVDWANELFKPGHIGVLSRSGGESGTVPWVLQNGGFGVSTAIHTGTEPILGMSFADFLLKPFVIYIAGAAAPEGQRFSHASAIVEKGRGSVKGKVKALKEAGAYPVDTPKNIVPTLKRLLNR